MGRGGGYPHICHLPGILEKNEIFLPNINIKKL
jgi:hypothetical protein